MAKDTHRVNSKDVAQLAGVSQSAVSRVYTPGASVSQKTIDKVHTAAIKLGYRPNVLARGLITGKSRIIGVVVGYLENQFYPEAVQKLTNSLQARGYHALIFMSSQREAEIDDILSEILDYKVDGLVIASVSMSSSLAQRCQAEGIPVVLFNRSQDDDRLSTVTSDNYVGGRKVAEFLVAGGHQRIGYIAGWEKATTQRDRENGFLNGLASKGMELYCRGVGNFALEEAKEATRRMFQQAEQPDAIFVANDHMAFAVMDTLRYEIGLRVPDDVSIVGYDDVPLASWPSYELTTVRQPINRMVSETVSTLMEYIVEGNRVPRRISLDGPLQIRKSARLLAQ